MEQLRSAHHAALSFDNETPRIVGFVRQIAMGGPAGVVVDIGCGYGRTLRAIKSSGIEAIGVDVNASIVERNRRECLRCMTSSEFASSTLGVYVMIMSQVIEHFAPEKLLDFMDDHLDRLRPDGYLIIATPLLHARFFDDFDHVKPYHPTGLTMVFRENDAQVQYSSRNRLVMTDLWFRRSPLTVNFARGLRLKNWGTRAWQAVNLLATVLFRASGGLVARHPGWVGVFRKEGTAVT